MLLTDARRPARTGPHGELVPLADQDRSRWDRALIAEGAALLAAVLPRRAVGEYQLQAAVAALHDEAATAEQTDWPQILALYGLLERMTGNPMVTLNRAIALAMVDGPAAGLAALAGLDERLPGYHRLDAVRAHLREMAGDPGAAVTDYLRAAGRTTSLAERDYLTARAARLRGAT
jgi:predicted RNA polymerase sigma factor